MVGLLDLALAGGAAYVAYLCIKIWWHNKLLSGIPGPPARWPFIGNLDLFWFQGVSLSEAIYRTVHALARLYGDEKGIYRFAMGPQTVVVVCKPETVEPILMSSVNLRKSLEYDLLNDWLGSGLLTSFGAKWKFRRRLLTPAFHFQVLEDFVPIMNERSTVMVGLMKEAAAEPHIDILKPIAALTLDVICETAMGVSLDLQRNLTHEYFQSIQEIGALFMARAYSPSQWNKLLYLLQPAGRRYVRCVKAVKSFTRKVISDRKEELLKSKDKINSSEDQPKRSSEGSKYRRSARKAFLDLLLEHHLKGDLELEDIREEVDTFMFEGHDTTAMSLSWTLFLLGQYPEIQERIQEELDEVFGDYRERPVTVDDLKRLNYLEAVLKEALRLRPSVPFIGRCTEFDMEIGGFFIPSGSPIFILLDYLHLNEEVFPEPHKFDPTRFTADNASGRHPTAYAPFSAGPRGCIGQKFALMEEKIILSHFFRNFNVKSIDPLDKVPMVAEMVLRPKMPLRIQILNRQ